MESTEHEALERRTYSVEDGVLSTTTDVSTELAPTAAAAEKQFEIQSAVVLARRFPRNEDQAFARLMKACQRTSFAEDAEYSYPRGGQNVSGPSINLAREGARVWGNIRHGFVVTTDNEGERTIRGFAWDLETNARVEAEDTFRKLVYRKKDGWIKPDERDLRELTNRRAAILKRNCILEILPKDLIEDAVSECHKTLRSKAEKDPEGEKKRIILAFAELNITPEMLGAYLGHPLAQCSPAEIAKLRGVYKSISDGNTTWADYVNGNTEADAADMKQKTKAKSQELKQKLGGESKPVDEAAEKKRIRKSIRDLFPEALIEIHTGGRDINALSLDELVTLKDALTEHAE